MDIYTSIIISIINISLLIFIISSIGEKEYRAASIGMLLIVLADLGWYFICVNIDIPFIYHLNISLNTIITALFIISFIKYFPETDESEPLNIEQFDERNHMFSRNNMQHYPELQTRYYKQYPEHEEIDNKLKTLPELGAPGSKYYDKYYSNIAVSGFSLLEKTAFLVKEKPQTPPVEIDINNTVNAIKFMAKYYGAVDIGFTKLHKHHYYSIHGRNAENWGAQIEKHHQFAIAIIVKMDPAMLKHSPSLPVMLESSKQYVEAAKIAHLIAEYIRNLGYDAKSHVDGNYDILAVPVARDAGMGEVGRMGILLHPKFGPAVRISVVTTDLQLPVTTSRKNYHIEEFCTICKKCAFNCPTKSIPLNDKPVSRNFAHWSIKQESCYGFWKKAGTDCAFCIRSCPYTKQDNILHRFVRFYISLNPVNQRIALFFDDIFYGKKYKIKKSNPDFPRIP